MDRAAPVQWRLPTRVAFRFALTFDRPDIVAVERMDGAIAYYAGDVDEGSHVVTLTAGSLSFQRPDPPHLKLDGAINGRATTIEAEMSPTSPLATRAFHWVQEYPNNR